MPPHRSILRESCEMVDQPRLNGRTPVHLGARRLSLRHCYSVPLPGARCSHWAHSWPGSSPGQMTSGGHPVSGMTMVVPQYEESRDKISTINSGCPFSNQISCASAGSPRVVMFKRVHGPDSGVSFEVIIACHECPTPLSLYSTAYPPNESSTSRISVSKGPRAEASSGVSMPASLSQSATSFVGGVTEYRTPILFYFKFRHRIGVDSLTTLRRFGNKLYQQG